ncbi:killer cell lectin-like receptor subfamily B member 1B allele C [Emys orbicularis]|uniref:killer cell lectin-like receptor subfamily B member 1B allele C n=1 Tax=Emys orbicularis TaxID=82168 RepID=UPI0031FE3E69
MAVEIVYADLNLDSGFPVSRAPLSAQPHSPQSPRWHRTALWVGWIGNIVLVIAVIALGIWVSHLVSEKGQTLAAPGSEGAGSRATATPPGSADTCTAECSARLERFRSQLCHPAPPGPAEGSGCKLCPTDWWLRGDKCYWVSRGGEMWSESPADCSARGSQLLVIRDPKKLEFTQNLTGNQIPVWIGLNITSPGRKWTWVDGSPLNQTLFTVSGPAEENSCAAIQKNQIQSDICTTDYIWICQKEAVLI